ncbi:hypothetical protein NDU88_003404 [Pleurodeles waltl]|uniref:Uncharacterized protein n=1 Tax=Pleurodeles waltl TaxID=8319 RepID=A0AAV7NGB6_PLEWA|nr:hypothetical protein NDU88_003404 [Pleurodeles waltl]
MRADLWRDLSCIQTSLGALEAMAQTDCTMIGSILVAGYQISRLLASQNQKRCPDSAAETTPHPDAMTTVTPENS